MKKQTNISIKANRPNSVKIWVGAVVFPNKHKTLKHCKLEPSKLKTPANNAKQKLQNQVSYFLCALCVNRVFIFSRKDRREVSYFPLRPLREPSFYIFTQRPQRFLSQSSQRSFFFPLRPLREPSFYLFTQRPQRFLSQSSQRSFLFPLHPLREPSIYFSTQRPQRFLIFFASFA